VDTPEGADEVDRVGVTDLTRELVDREIGLDEQAPCLCHPALLDPFLHRPAGLAADDCRQVTAREVDGRQDVAE
jgi:hypothetical protein